MEHLYLLVSEDKKCNKIGTANEIKNVLSGNITPVEAFSNYMRNAS